MLDFASKFMSFLIVICSFEVQRLRVREGTVRVGTMEPALDSLSSTFQEHSHYHRNFTMS